MSNTQNRSTTRRPRLSVAVRTRIVQIRASDEAHPPSLDRILDRLREEGFDPLPSRGSVQNVVHAWGKLPKDVKNRDLPFQWHQLDRARIPWEASEWVLDVLHAHEWQVMGLAKRAEEPDLPSFSAAQILERRGRFTNRMATWSWRIHQAAPEITPGYVLVLANLYALEEQARDVLADNPPMQVEPYDAWLTFRPYRMDFEGTEDAGNIYEDAGNIYDDAIRLGMIPALPSSYDRGTELAKLLSEATPFTSEFFSWLRAFHLDKWLKPWQKSTQGEHDERPPQEAEPE